MHIVVLSSKMSLQGSLSPKMEELIEVTIQADNLAKRPPQCHNFVHHLDFYIMVGTVTREKHVVPQRHVGDNVQVSKGKHKVIRACDKIQSTSLGADIYCDNVEWLK